MAETSGTSAPLGGGHGSFFCHYPIAIASHLDVPSENLTPIADLFEAHLTVNDLDRAVAFYRDQLALPLAQIFLERKVAFFWIGAPGKAMLGLWEAGTMPINVSLHVAFQVALSDLHDAPAKLQNAGIQPRDFTGLPSEEPVVLAWMPAAFVYWPASTMC